MAINPRVQRLATVLALVGGVMLLILGLFWFGGVVSTRQAGVTTPTPAAVLGADTTPKPMPIWDGTIAGKVEFPADAAPGQLVCAVHVEDLREQRCIDYSSGTSVNFLLNVPPGKYFVAAHPKVLSSDYPASYRAYYDEYVKCRRSSDDCADDLHAKRIVVTVTSGKTTGGVDPTDWYAPADAPPPTPVPSPSTSPTPAG